MIEIMFSSLYAMLTSPSTMGLMLLGGLLRTYRRRDTGHWRKVVDRARDPLRLRDGNDPGRRLPADDARGERHQRTNLQHPVRSSRRRRRRCHHDRWLSDGQEGRGRPRPGRQHYGVGCRRHHRRDCLRDHDPRARAGRAVVQPGRILPAGGDGHHLHRLPCRRQSDLQRHHCRPVRDDAGHHRHRPIHRRRRASPATSSSCGTASAWSPPCSRYSPSPKWSHLPSRADRFPRCRWKPRISPIGSCSKASWKCRGIGGSCSAPRLSARLSAWSPGLGGSAAAWMCYGHAVQTSKHPERFGKGAVEGVIAPEYREQSPKRAARCFQRCFSAFPAVPAWPC